MNSTSFDPYDTTSLHIFIRETFSGATLMEEHQVCVYMSVCDIYPLKTHVHAGFSDIPVTQ